MKKTYCVELGWNAEKAVFFQAASNESAIRKAEAIARYESMPLLSAVVLRKRVFPVRKMEFVGTLV